MSRSSRNLAPPVTLGAAPSAAEPVFRDTFTALQPRWPILRDPGVRQAIKEQFIEEHGDEHAVDDDAQRSTLEEAVQAYVPAKAAEYTRLAISVRRADPTLRAAERRLEVSLPKDRGETPPYAKPREKNTLLLTFVAERVVPFQQLLRGDLTPLSFRHPGIPWEPLHAEWSRTRPEHPIKSWRAFRESYYKAARHPWFRHQLLEAVDREVRGVVDPLLSRTTGPHPAQTTPGTLAHIDALGSYITDRLPEFAEKWLTLPDAPGKAWIAGPREPCIICGFTPPPHRVRGGEVVAHAHVATHSRVCLAEARHQEVLVRALLLSLCGPTKSVRRDLLLAMPLHHWLITADTPPLPVLHIVLLARARTRAAPSARRPRASCRGLPHREE